MAAGKESYKCNAHNKVDCGTCFNWVKMVKDEAKAAEDQAKWLAKRSKAMDRMGFD